MPVGQEFGNALWYLLHCFGHRCVEGGLIKEYYRFEKSLLEIIPCTQCRSHYKGYLKLLLKKTPEFADEDKDKILWRLNYLHNSVNGMFGKRIWSLNDSIEEWRQRSSDLKELKDVFFRVILTYADFWVGYWKKSINVEQCNAFRCVVNNGLKILGEDLNDVSTYFGKIHNNDGNNNLNLRVYRRVAIWEMFKDSYNLDVNRIDVGFAFSTDGCSLCTNK
jgi:hypothetical protein